MRNAANFAIRQLHIFFFSSVFLSQLYLIQHSRNFSECRRKLLIGEFLRVIFFLYAQQKGGISDLFLSILNTAVMVIEQVTVVT